MTSWEFGPLRFHPPLTPNLCARLFALLSFDEHVRASKMLDLVDNRNTPRSSLQRCPMIDVVWGAGATPKLWCA